MTRLWTTRSCLLSLLCSACMVGPKYQRPVAQTPVALKEIAGNDQWKMATPSDGLLKGKWWEIFGDPELNRLEELVNVNNQNVKQAEAQFREARAVDRRQSRQLLSHHRIEPGHHAKRRRSKCGQRRRNQPRLFPTRHRHLGAGSVGPRSSVGGKCRRQRAGERRRSGERPPQRSRRCWPPITFCWPRRTCSWRSCKTPSTPTRRTWNSPSTASTAASHRSSDITLAQTQLCRRQGPGHRNPRRRARQYEHAIAVLTGQPPSSLGHRHQQDRRAASAHPAGGSFAASRTAPRYRRQ